MARVNSQAQDDREKEELRRQIAEYSQMIEELKKQKEAPQVSTLSVPGEAELKKVELKCKICSKGR